MPADACAMLLERSRSQNVKDAKPQRCIQGDRLRLGATVCKFFTLEALLDSVAGTISITKVPTGSETLQCRRPRSDSSYLALGSSKGCIDQQGPSLGHWERSEVVPGLENPAARKR